MKKLFLLLFTIFLGLGSLVSEAFAIRFCNELPFEDFVVVSYTTAADDHAAVILTHDRYRGEIEHVSGIYGDRTKDTYTIGITHVLSGTTLSCTINKHDAVVVTLFSDAATHYPKLAIETEDRDTGEGYACFDHKGHARHVLAECFVDVDGDTISEWASCQNWAVVIEQAKKLIGSRFAATWFTSAEDAIKAALGLDYLPDFIF